MEVGLPACMQNKDHSSKLETLTKLALLDVNPNPCKGIKVEVKVSKINFLFLVLHK